VLLKTFKTIKLINFAFISKYVFVFNALSAFIIMAWNISLQEFTDKKEEV